jgi:hypothetical protein
MPPPLKKIPSAVALAFSLTWSPAKRSRLISRLVMESVGKTKNPDGELGV